MCVIRPSVANAMNVPATLVPSTTIDKSGIVRGVIGNSVIAMKPTDTIAMAIRYQRLRESV